MIEYLEDGCVDPNWCPDCGLPDGVCDCGQIGGREPYDYDEDDGRDDWGCCLGDECLMPNYDHLASECYNVEMAEAWSERTP